MATPRTSITVIWLDRLLERLHGPSWIQLFKALASQGYAVHAITGDVSSVRIPPRLSLTGRGTRTELPVLSWAIFLLRNLTLRVRDSVLFIDASSLPLIPFYRMIQKPILVVLSILSRPVETRGIKGKLNAIQHTVFIRISKRLVDFTALISEPEALQYHTEYGIEPKKLVVMPSILGLDIFAGKEDPKRAKLPREGLELLYHGSLSQSRGLLTAIQAINQYDGDGPTVSLRLLGRFTEKPSRTPLPHIKQTANVSFYGVAPYEQVPEYLAAADAGVVPHPDHPWWRNQCPTKLLEYLSMGKPVILTDLPGHRWILKDCEEAAVFAADDTPQALVEAIGYASDNINELTTNAQKATEKVQARFGDKHIARRMIRWLDKRIKARQGEGKTEVT